MVSCYKVRHVAGERGTVRAGERGSTPERGGVGEERGRAGKAALISLPEESNIKGTGVTQIPRPRTEECHCL